MRWLWTLLLALSGACSLVLEADQGPQGDGGTGPGGDNPRDGCGGLALLADDFEDPAVSHQWEVKGSSATAEPQEIEGDLVITLDSGEEGLYRSLNAYDLREGSLTVEVPQLVPSGVAARLVLEGLNEPGFEPDELEIAFLDGNLAFSVEPGGQSKEFLDSFDYDETAHRFWRIAEREGRIHFQTAPEASGPFMSHARTGTLESFDQVLVSLRAEDRGSGGGGETRLDALVGAGAAPACAAARFVDDFAGDSIDRMWSQSDVSDPACDFVPDSGGAVRITAIMDDACSLDLAPPVSLQDSSVTVELRALPTDPDATLFIELGRGEVDEIVMAFNDGDLESFATAGSATSLQASMPLGDLGDARVWRISGAMAPDGAEVRFEYSADGAEWNTLERGAAPFPLGELDLRIGIAGSGAAVRIEGVNTL